MKYLILTLALLMPSCALLESAGASGDPVAAAAALESQLAALEAVYADVQDADGTLNPETLPGALSLILSMFGGAALPTWAIALMGAFMVYQRRKAAGAVPVTVVEPKPADPAPTAGPTL